LRFLRNTNGTCLWPVSGPVLVLSTLAILLSGCTSVRDIGEVNSFIDPTEPNVRPLDSAPLVKPILDTLDPSVEEPEDLFNNATDIQPDDLIPEKGDYRIGKNDLVSVSIYDLLGEGTGEQVKTVRVSESGYLALDFIKPVYAEGYTEQELQDVIKQAYADAGQIKNARVTVTVAEERARTFTIYGNVGTEGQYQILQNDFRMLDALVIGKGPASPEGVDYCFVIRQPPAAKTPPVAPSTEPSSPTDQEPTLPAPPTTELLEPPHSQANPPADSPRMLATSGTTQLLAPDNTGPTSGVVEGQAVPVQQDLPSAASRSSEQPPSGPGGLAGFKFNGPGPNDQRVIRVPLKDLRNGHLEDNIVIRPGDLIFVPDPVEGEYYMGGHVQRTGVYSLTGRKITLKQAIVSAGMFDQAAIPGRSEIIRRVGPNKEVFVRVDLDKVFGGWQPDIYLKPNDQIQVGTNVIAPFLAAVRNAFRASYGFGFTYDANYAPINNGGSGGLGF
jgi:polysaccharide biosynthesis/export protein